MVTTQLQIEMKTKQGRTSIDYKGMWACGLWLVLIAIAIGIAIAIDGKGPSPFFDTDTDRDCDSNRMSGTQEVWAGMSTKKRTRKF
jgi:hypothetical protein